MNWTLTYDGVTKSLADWGFSGCRRSVSSLGVDTFSARAVVSDAFAAPVIPYDGEVTVYRDGAPWFYGRRVLCPADFSPVNESLDYEFAGPWKWLEELIYQIVWNDNSVHPPHTSHVLLNNELGTKGQIEAAVQYAIDRGCPLLLGTIDLPTMLVPVTEIRDTTVAEVIRTQMRWHPDAVGWFDYSTTPPTFKVSRHSVMTAETLALDGKSVAAGQIVARPDLQIDHVALRFETTQEVTLEDGSTETRLIITEQNYPPGTTGLEPGALCSTINLEGEVIATASCHLECMPLAKDSLAWWKAKFPELGDAATAKNVTLGPVELQPATFGEEEDPIDTALPNELIWGQIPDWLGAGAAAVVVKAAISGEIYDKVTGLLTSKKSEERSLKLVLTDAVTGDYSTVTNYVPGEPEPAGLAQALYNAAHVLHYSGSATVVQEECGGTAFLGKKLHLTGGHVDWATMGALVQRVVESIDEGMSQLSFGPPPVLGANDLVALLRANRVRQRRIPLTAAADMERPGNNIGLGTYMPKDDGTGVTNKVVRLVARTPVTTGTGGEVGGIIDIDSAVCQGKTVSVREIAVCQNGVQKKMLVLASEVYE